MFAFSLYLDIKILEVQMTVKCPGGVDPEQ